MLGRPVPPKVEPKGSGEARSRSRRRRLDSEVPRFGPHPGAFFFEDPKGSARSSRGFLRVGRRDRRLFSIRVWVPSG